MRIIYRVKDKKKHWVYQKVLEIITSYAQRKTRSFKHMYMIYPLINLSHCLALEEYFLLLRSTCTKKQTYLDITKMTRCCFMNKINNLKTRVNRTVFLSP